MRARHYINKILEIIRTPFLSVYDYCVRVETAMLQGHELHVDIIPLQNIERGYGDWLIHPCVRYIPEGFAGHKWWMVCTPYPNFNSHYENPVLYYGDGNEEVPPLTWKFVAVVQPPYKNGYNADSNLFYDEEKLWITWKEAETPNTKTENGYKVIMGCFYDGQTFSTPRVICKNPDDTNMYLASQVLLRVKDELKLFAVFTPNSYRLVPNNKKGERHIAIFGKDKDGIQFQFEGVRRQFYPKGFDFWHIDIFTYREKYYCLVTPESADRILLGESEDGIQYHFFKEPLLHANGKERTPYMYKVSGLVENDMFHLFYPMRKKEKNIVHLHVTSMNFNELLQKLRKQ